MFDEDAKGHHHLQKLEALEEFDPFETSDHFFEGFHHCLEVFGIVAEEQEAETR